MTYNEYLTRLLAYQEQEKRMLRAYEKKKEKKFKEENERLRNERLIEIYKSVH